ncbi:cobyrinate a,c-diamide synthase [Candidatus Desulfovibrio trichonymphae]|uniref:Cobyrinic acid a,c-diamide synthase n=1 Tax=Candidatus Desulfovibrio trichonymphae TaxID=1725232 RepID=A0A1J1E0X0_9BACT|nr:cobyrinate a,c-diamide synthase [Candidatus Desulfovibrio trichonymphae]BAV91523.1 cobyrinic acid a,c-diamide synthase [Candidatus Desulfovibrio trichonymphae]
MESTAPAGGIPALLIGGTASGAGKTTTTLALLCALKARGFAVAAAKAGPDFIDAGFHAAVSGTPVANLDVWMSRGAKPGVDHRRASAGLVRVVSRIDALRPDIMMVEGAMGLYDGAANGIGSTAHLAALLDLPVLLLLNAGGLGQSVAALAEGFLRHRPAWNNGRGIAFAGLVCTHVGGEKHKKLLRSALAVVEREMRVPLIGLLPRAGAPRLQSRHLGLVQAYEAAALPNQKALADWLEIHCDVGALLRRIGVPQKRKAAGACAARHQDAVADVVQDCPVARGHGSASPQYFFVSAARRGTIRRRRKIGIAWDEAFSFCYADLPALLAELGAETIFFSPLKDVAPPECDGLYFPGGYPELHARELAANTAMFAALRALAVRNLPVYGECGGYIYLMRGLRHADTDYAMAGLLPVHCIMDGRKAALGYRAVLAHPDWLLAARCGRPLWSRGHEFHYGRLADAALPPGCAPLWLLYDSQSVLLGQEGCRYGSVIGSWVHLCPEGARRFWQIWLHGEL